MNDYFQENKRSLFLLTGLFLLLVIVLYFLLLRPLMVDLSSKEKEIRSVKDDIQQLEKELDYFDLDSVEVDVEKRLMEKKIPTEKELDEYILSLQQLEVITGSKMEHIEFLYDSNLEEIEGEENRLEEESTNTDDENENESDDDNTEEDQEEITTEPEIFHEKPEDLQVMTVKLIAASPDFDEFIKLLKVIENEERISIVSKLHFLKPSEQDIYFTEDPTKAVFFEAELTTFYYSE